MTCGLSANRLALVALVLVVSPLGAGALWVRRAEHSDGHSKPEEQDHAYAGPDWGILDPEGGNMKTKEWVAESASFASYFFASLFVLLIGSIPVILNYADEKSFTQMTKTAMVESVLLYVWLIGGLYLFTNVLYFQSPHFNGKVRSLNLEEAVYLFSQIITTVGYGDITPAKPRGQLFVGVFVVLSFCLIAGMAAQLADIISNKLAKKLGLTKDTPRDAPKCQNPARKALQPVCTSLGVFACFVIIGTVFFSQYPGEKKTVGQGLYMSLVTLSSVGFGAFTPVTKVGMVFGAFWMLFGVSSIASLIASFSAFITTMKAWEKAQHNEEKDRKGKA